VNARIWKTILGLTAIAASGCHREAPAGTTVDFVSTKPQLVEFGTGDGCLLCKLMKPVLADLKQEQASHFSVVIVDLRKDREAIQRRSVFLSVAISEQTIAPIGERVFSTANLEPF
jgi:thiol-disulfide isomerase/thioredoxin